MIKTISILALGLAIGLPSAFATPTLSITVQETGVSGGLSATSGTGFVAISNVAYGDFTVNNVTGAGTPILAAPADLNLQTLNISAPTLSTSKTLTIELTETGITGVPNPFNFFNAFTGLLHGVTSETLTTYTDPTNTAFGMTDQVASTIFTLQGANALNKVKTAPTGSPYSETEVIVAVFGATSHPDSLDSSIFMGAAIPEPASLALIGVGLLGLAVARKRRSS